MQRDFAEVDVLISELADVHNECAEKAAEKLMRTCSRSGDAFQHLEKRASDAAISGPARNQAHLIIAKIRAWTLQDACGEGIQIRTLAQ